MAGTSTHPAPAEIEREPLCSVPWCPFPSSPDFHQCWCGRLDVEHHHVDPRGMGGSPERRDDPDNIQCVCPPHHKAVTTEGYTDEINDGYYIMRNPKGAQLVKHLRYQPDDSKGLSAATEVTTEAETEVSGSDPVVVPLPSAAALSPLDDWCRRGMGFVYNGERLDALTDEWRFQVGEWLNEGEGVMPEEVHGYLRGFRKERTLWQYAWVAAVVTRVTGLSWTHHRAVAALPAPERQEKLELALTDGLSSRAMMAVGREPRERHACPDCGQEHVVKS